MKIGRDPRTTERHGHGVNRTSHRIAKADAIAAARTDATLHLGQSLLHQLRKQARSEHKQLANITARTELLQIEIDMLKVGRAPSQRRPSHALPLPSYA